MKKITAVSLSVALFASLTSVFITSGPTPASASSTKEWVKISEQVTYYGEVKDGIPNGRGTIQWGDNKQYSGDFVAGKREGSGKYMNEYVSEGEKHKVVYSGTWKQDVMDGKGTLTHKVTQEDGAVRWNEIQTGAFKNGSIQTGYDVIHALADPDFSFNYKSPQETLAVLGSNINLKQSLKNGTLFSVDYRKGSIAKSYSIFPADTQAKQRINDAALKYLQSIQSRLNPHFDEFEKLSKQVPLK
ncbi:hypothetical protein GRF59_05780 [Paenibacillus sp. HJL G12]|uniref:MORN repeat-containing protein n=1 Tax=Paenibacillus dendrobii TaxID=2691084 RepID=A0A7X3IFU1_9BACL|nr:hypothetical protein [Paenibacillus dendrobii]MWV43134.1 hypothetical protein [Paenibacillus dendrobii]